MRLDGKLAAALALSIVLGGCATRFSETPLATNYPTTKQNKTQAAAHWGVIAADMATQLKGSIGAAPVFVASAAKDSEFSRAFRNQLISALVTQGNVVLKAPAVGVQTLDLETQLIRFSPERNQNRYFVSATALAAGLWGVHGLNLGGEATAIAGTLALGGLIDWNQWYRQEFAVGETPRYELLVTASLSNGQQYLGRSTNAYYIHDLDSELYKFVSSSTIGMRVKGGD